MLSAHFVVERAFILFERAFFFERALILLFWTRVFLCFGTRVFVELTLFLFLTRVYLCLNARLFVFERAFISFERAFICC